MSLSFSSAPCFKTGRAFRFGAKLLGLIAGATLLFTAPAFAGTFSARKAVDSTYAYNTRGLVLASDGKLYGLSKFGGTTNGGTIFSLNPDGSGFTVVHSFATGTDGSAPNGYLIEVSGKLYGLAAGGGTGGNGTFFSYTLSGGAFATLHSFVTADGTVPLGSLVFANNQFYGTTTAGGSSSRGTVFAATLGGSISVLHNYSPGETATGSTPLLGADGKLYGTSSNTVFSINGSTYATVVTLPSNKGSTLGDLAQDPSTGTLYGLAYSGGSANVGTLFSLPTTGTNVAVLHNFGGAEGLYPLGGPLLLNGRLYGTTNLGGSGNGGTLFSCDTGTGSTFQVEHAFNYNSDGGYSWGKLLLVNGLVYGTTTLGGPGGSGAVFSFDTNNAPVAAFTVTPNPQTLGSPLFFIGNASSDPDSGDHLVNYSWDFGDGSPALSGSTSVSPTYTYFSSGAFNVTLTVTDTHGATGNFSQIVTINKVSQTLSFGSLPGKIFGAPAFTINASASSGLTPTFSIVSGPASLTGPNTVTLTAVGMVTVRASQAGNGIYSAAADIDRSFSVTASLPNDFNGDNHADLIWQNATTGDIGFWLMSGTGVTSWVDLGLIATSWKIVGAADFDGDGRPDLVWENTATGERYVWLMAGTAYSAGVSLGVISTDWHIAALADFDGDGKPDILWENTVTGDRGFWLMNGTTFSSWVDIGVIPTALRIVGSGDFNADGKTDIVWENMATGKRVIWLMNGTTFVSSVNLGIVSTDWHIGAVADFNGDGQPDLLWENTVTGERLYWLMNGTAFGSALSLGVVTTDWKIAN